MEKMINELIEAAKKDRRGLIRLKNAAVTLGNFEFAAKLREIETKYHPETDEQKAAKKRAKELNLLFRMVDLNIPEDKCWLIEQTLKDAQKKKGKFSINCATKLRIKEVEIFYTED